MNRKQRRAQDKENGENTSRKAPSPSPDTTAGTRDPLELHALGIQALHAGRLDIAARLIAQAIAIDGNIPALHYNLAIVHKARGRLQEAAASYQRAIALKPDHADAHNNLGNVWKALGARDKARASFERALQLKPGNADTHYSLGLLCSETGEQEEAARHLQECLKADPEDARGAGILLAHLGLADTPERTSPAQLQKIYDVRAQFWDRERSYFGHKLVSEGLREHAARKDLDILDIGCGTGLAGAEVHGLARRLDGVDLSSAMLEKARSKTVYDRLEQADLVSYLAGQEDRYDVVLGAATLIHFGNLQPLFRAAGSCLRQDGLFVFTLFAGQNGGADFSVAAQKRLAESGCFQHNKAYVERLAGENGFSVTALKEVLHEYDQDGNPVAGLLVVLRRQIRRRANGDMS